MPAADLKKKLIDLCQARSKPYGIVVRKMDFPSSATVDEARRIISESQGSSHAVSTPILAYKVFPDGHEELVRGLAFPRVHCANRSRTFWRWATTTSRSNTWKTARPSPSLAAADSPRKFRVIAPSIIIDDLELHPVEEEMPKLPMVPPPDMVKH